MTRGGVSRVGRALVRIAVLTSAIALAPFLAIAGWALCEPLPAALTHELRAPSVRIDDRSGKLIREVRDAEGRSTARVPLRELSPFVVPCLLAAEDARFRLHPGIDPLAIGRAAWQALRARHIVSGASTITQQLARTLIARPRTLGGKLHEMAVALRIEASLDKDRILEEYLARVEFGPGLVGIDAASRAYFDKPVRALDLSEAATLVAAVRNPNLYDPRRHPERARRGRERVLARVLSLGSLAREAVDAARSESIVTRRAAAEGGALHAALAVATGALAPALEGERVSSVQTTLDSALQHELEAVVDRAGAELDAIDASAVALLVVENATGDVLAHVGSPDYFDAAALGSNDGTRALRQPGSALKPFVYAAAMQRLGWTLATLLPDLSLSLPTADGGRYMPKNYDGREHGPVRLRAALANSLNLPAVYAATQVGPSAVLGLLHRLGFASLNRDAAHYGAAIALGDGEVRLSELAAAYATLANEGAYRPLRYVLEAKLESGARVHFDAGTAERVLEPSVARQLTDALADDAARSAMFGPRSALAFDFPVAAKTGTSKGFRDNWAVAYTREITVAVWVGNFDARPLVRSSGVSGAGPILHAAMEAAMRGRERGAWPRTDGLVEREICALSGELATSACPVRVRERFPAARAPASACSFHELVALDTQNGLRAGLECHDAEQRVFERYPAKYQAWARASGRPLAPGAWSPRCPTRAGAANDELAIAWPATGQTFVLDAERERQQIVVVARGRRTGSLTLAVDGRERARSRDDRVAWQLEAGEHVLSIREGARESAPVRVRVR